MAEGHGPRERSDLGIITKAHRGITNEARPFDGTGYNKSDLVSKFDILNDPDSTREKKIEALEYIVGAYYLFISCQAYSLEKRDRYRDDYNKFLAGLNRLRRNTDQGDIELPSCDF